MEPEKTNDPAQAPADVTPKEIILHEDGPVIITPSMATGTITGIYQGNTTDGVHHIFKDAEEGFTFHVPFLGQIEKALKVATEKGIDPIGKLIKIIILDAGRYLIKLIEE
jgi:hypothetical protein